MELAEVRKKYLDFFAARGHTVIPSAALVPENDPTTLFTSSGMQPLVPYLLGQPHPEGRRLVDSQKSFRADDIDEVGDNRHTTFFEMLGNWSLGDYFKADQLKWIFEFLTDKNVGVGLDPMNLYVTVFAGDSEMEIPADDESVKIWTELFHSKDIEAKYVALGSEENASAVGMQGGRIFSYDVKKNWWSRAGVPAKMPAGEPGGPDSEVFYDFGATNEQGVPRHDPKFGAQCHPNCDCGRFLEIGNSVFMEYKKREDGRFEKLSQQNVDFGGGLERITAATNGDPDVFHIDVFRKMVEVDPAFGRTEEDVRKVRVILDHMRASVFLIGDGVLPSNKGQGYVLRRLLRRTALFGMSIRPEYGWVTKMVGVLAALYKDSYPNISEDADSIIKTIAEEFAKFMAAVDEGLKEFKKRAEAGMVTGKDAFDLYQSYGFPWELTQEMATEKGIKVNEEEFEREFTKHRDLSRTASAGTFKGGLADTSEKTVRLHTAHHLLLRALQQVLGPTVKQRGSNITSERLRLDYLHDAKLTDEQKAEVERIVNEKIAEDLPVLRNEMAREDAEKLGAEHEFGQKYPERVSVYSIGPKGATLADPQFDKAFSIEFCGGPHVSHTGEIGRFRIAKEEAVAAGIRRIRGVIE
ncbi:MAG TPA: alanine--tRNA ligase [Candidatus Paceibacterota bacterium]|nr:alanine--tRNA ligase [Candidatus Paceibacterota bacterium]